MAAESTPLAVWSCHDADVPHSRHNVHERGTEDGLPFYPLIEDGLVQVTICQKCHGRIPGHMIRVRPDDLEEYFEIVSVEELFKRLPSGHVGSGTSQTFHRRLFELAMSAPYSPYPDHAGRTLQASLVHQWEEDDLQPPQNADRIEQARNQL
jgi:hypothetical protein